MVNKVTPPRFYPPEQTVPLRWRSASFLLEPLTPAHTALDYAALLESRAFLRRWSGSSWPGDDFTLADNRADLAGHAEEQRRRVAFTYTVLDPDRRRCLGCVYIKPLATLIPSAAAGAGAGLAVGDDEAAVRWWVTTPLLAEEGDVRLLETLLAWFEKEWVWRRVIFHTPAALRQQTARYPAVGLRFLFTVELPGRGGTHECWG
jgi:hypothetical protein